MNMSLFPIPVMAENSGDIEAFPSYMRRCAYHHGLSVRVFLKHVKAIHAFDSPNNQQGILVPKHLCCESFLRPTNNNLRLAEKLGELTRNKELKKTMIWWLRHSLQKGKKGLYSRSFRWCPACFDEMDDFGQERYIKLIWFFDEVKTCFKHNSPILERCPKCNSLQNGGTTEFAVGYCIKCGESLATASDYQCDKFLNPTSCGADEKNDWYDVAKNSFYFGNEESFRWLSQGIDLQKLLADISSAKNPIINAKSALRGIEQILEHFPLSSTNKGLLTFHVERIRRNGLSSMQQIRRIAYDAGVPLYDLLTGNVRQLSFLAENGGCCSFRPSFFTINKRIDRDHEAVSKLLRQTIESSNPPLSLNEIAAKTNVSTGYIEYRFPELAKKAVRAHQQYLTAQKASETMKALSIALKHKVELGESYPSKRYLYRYLRRTTDVSKSNILTALEQIYASST